MPRRYISMYAWSLKMQSLLVFFNSDKTNDHWDDETGLPIIITRLQLRLSPALAVAAQYWQTRCTCAERVQKGKQILPNQLVTLCAFRVWNLLVVCWRILPYTDTVNRAKSGWQFCWWSTMRFSSPWETQQWIRSKLVVWERKTPFCRDWQGNKVVVSTRYGNVWSLKPPFIGQ